MVLKGTLASGTGRGGGGQGDRGKERRFGENGRSRALFAPIHSAREGSVEGFLPRIRHLKPNDGLTKSMVLLSEIFFLGGGGAKDPL